MGPQNVLMGDELAMPQSSVDEKELVVEKQMANYTKTEDFKRIQEYCQSRIDFYQTHLPNGKIIGLEAKPTEADWAAANIIISEFKLLMGNYVNATEAVEAINV
jgi:hypothetical protein